MKTVILSFLLVFLSSILLSQNKLDYTKKIIILHVKADSVKDKLDINSKQPEFIFLEINKTDTVNSNNGWYANISGFIYNSSGVKSAGTFKMKEASFYYKPTYVDILLEIGEKQYTIQYTGYTMIGQSRGLYFELFDNRNNTDKFTDKILVEKGNKVRSLYK